jgi:hypothetical protein
MTVVASTPTAITVSQPAAGSTYKRGNSIPIVWTPTGTGNVTISTHNQDGRTPTIINDDVGVIPDTGSYTYNTSSTSTNTGQFKIRVTKSNSTYGESAIFTINPATSPTCNTITASFTIA